WRTSCRPAARGCSVSPRWPGWSHRHRRRRLSRHASTSFAGCWDTSAADTSSAASNSGSGNTTSSTTSCYRRPKTSDWPPTPPRSPEVIQASSPTPPQSPMAGSTQPSPTVETLTPSLKPIVTTRSPTPPRSPDVIKTSSPKSNATHPSATPTPHPEPEPKRTFERDNGTKNDGTRTSSNGAGETSKNNHSSNHNGSSKHNSPHGDVVEEKRSASNAAAAAAKKEEENETRAVTIAGHNLGAHMDLGSSYAHHSRKQQLHDHNMEGKAQTEEGETTKAAIKQKPSITLVNSNVQTVNNSLLVDSSCIFGSPGVHINLTTQESHPSLHSDQEQGVDPAPAK
ncbi:unnamed protein product, partial [Musa textilis]